MFQAFGIAGFQAMKIGYFTVLKKIRHAAPPFGSIMLTGY
jgi:hypothetical protein